MSPDDPRHGTTRGFNYGCRCAPCRAARARWEKRRRLRIQSTGRGYSIPALGAQRRLQALMSLGWSSNDIAREAGWGHRNHVFRVLNGQKGRPCRWLEEGTFTVVCAVYERLSMRIPEMTPQRARTKAYARRNGFAPPLAWDDIDDPDEIPAGHRPAESRRTRYDEEVVRRIIAGESLPASTPERREVVRRWVESGRPQSELKRLTGWKVERYVEREAS